MKKRIVSLILLCALVLTLSACGGVLPPPEIEKTELELLTDKLSYSYESIKLTVVSTVSGLTLTDIYEASFDETGNKANVEFTVESMVPFEIVGGEYALPEYSSPVIQDYGTAEVTRAGEVTFTFGDRRDIDLCAIVYPKLAFSENSLSEYEITETEITATVKSPKALGGFYQGIPSGAEISAVFDSDMFKSIVITYTTAKGSLVEITYTFN